MRVEAKGTPVRKGDLLKVRVDIPADRGPDWPAIRKSIENWAAKQGVAFVQVQPIHEPPSPERPKALAKSDEDLVKAYAKRQGWGSAITKIGLKLL